MGTSPRPTRMSPEPMGMSPGPTRVSPEPTGTSPGSTGTSPESTGTSLEPTRMSPGPTRMSPEPMGMSPGPTGVSPEPTRTSPGSTGTSPESTGTSLEPTRMSPGPTGTSPGPTGTHQDIPRTDTSPGPPRLPPPVRSSRPIYSPFGATGTATGPGPRPGSFWDISGTFLPRCRGTRGHSGAQPPRGWGVWGPPCVLQAIKGPWAHPRAAQRVHVGWGQPCPHGSPVGHTRGAGMAVSPWLCVTLCHSVSPCVTHCGGTMGLQPLGWCHLCPLMPSPWGSSPSVVAGVTCVPSCHHRGGAGAQLPPCVMPPLR
ncbi:MAPK-interacting and spindle-stabilizing protein-like [Passer montanus]|uniref:MAPK-interacting and spindle-stabilizing protein-like n=1 Tax=Passer montanus TaxID=9160 RepID=UPI0019611F3B|nr:MAPK-interacting and spindle-stabilizing protein-like [Passer montanus]